MGRRWDQRRVGLPWRADTTAVTANMLSGRAEGGVLACLAFLIWYRSTKLLNLADLGPTTKGKDELDSRIGAAEAGVDVGDQPLTAGK